MFNESSERQEYFFSNLLFKEFAIINFGHEKCLPEHSFGPAIRDYYIMHYIIDGEGTYTDEEKTYKLRTGNFFIIKPDDLYAVYQADKENPWEYAWIGFEGTKAVEIVERQLGFISGNTVGKIKDSVDKSNTDRIKNDINRILYILADENENFLLVQGILYQFLSLFFQQHNNAAVSSMKQLGQKYVDMFINIVRQSYWDKELSIEKIAAIINVHPVYLNQKVKEKLNVTCSNDLMTYRINKANFLLESTNNSVGQIASQVGYQNPFSFTRAYKHIYGHSPSHHRRRIR